MTTPNFFAETQSPLLKVAAQVGMRQIARLVACGGITKYALEMGGVTRTLAKVRPAVSELAGSPVGILGGMGAATGGLSGALQAEEGHRLEGAGRGALVGGLSGAAVGGLLRGPKSAPLPSSGDSAAAAAHAQANAMGPGGLWEGSAHPPPTRVYPAPGGRETSVGKRRAAGHKAVSSEPVAEPTLNIRQVSGGKLDPQVLAAKMVKQGARAGLRQITKLVQGGNLAKADQLARAPGVLKATAAGSQIKHLGQGSEGVASLVAHPEHGVAVRKLYDPQGIASPELIARKAQVGKALGANPAVAQFKGEAATPHGGGQMHFSEYVPGGKTPFAAGSAAENAAVRQTKADTLRGLRGVGFKGEDIRHGNMVFDANKQRFRTVDYIPSRRGEFLPRASGRPDNVLPHPTATGQVLFGSTGENATPKAQLMQQMLGGKSSAPAASPGGPKLTHTQLMARLGEQQAPGMASRAPVQGGTAVTSPARAVPTPKAPGTSIGTAVLGLQGQKGLAAPALARTMPAPAVPPVSGTAKTMLAPPVAR